MSDSDETLDLDAELRGLFQAAELDYRDGVYKGDGKKAKGGEKSEDLNIVSALRPIVQGIEAITRATGENTSLLNRIEKSVSNEAEINSRLVAELRAIVDQKSGVNQRMFDALHEELRTYKDGFLLDSVQLPIIRDLVMLLDDLTMIYGQMEAALKEVEDTSQPFFAKLQKSVNNLEHNMAFVTEVLARMDVFPLPVGQGKLDKRTQRAVLIEPAASIDNDGDVLRVLKQGFVRKDRVVRAEEVVIARWRPASGEGESSL